MLGLGAVLLVFMTNEFNAFVELGLFAGGG